MIIAERLPVVSNFTMGFIAGSDKYENFDSSLDTTSLCYIIKG